MITLNTILYEGNFLDVLNENSWFFKFENKHITKKLLTINNLKSIDLFNKLVNDLKNKHEFDVIFVNDYEKEALEYFNLNMDSNSIGYLYSIPYFVSILNIKTPFIFNVSSDCCNPINLNNDYFEKSIKILSENNNFLVTTIPWEQDWTIVGTPIGVPSYVTCVGEWEQINSIKYNDERALDDFWCCGNFSDQVFIGNIEKLKKADYNCPKMGIYKGPEYGGVNAFEARLSEYIANNDIFNLIFKDKELYYKHIK
jgi:hypothetical protein